MSRDAAAAYLAAQQAEWEEEAAADA